MQLAVLILLLNLFPILQLKIRRDSLEMASKTLFKVAYLLIYINPQFKARHWLEQNRLGASFILLLIKLAKQLLKLVLKSRKLLKTM